MICEKCGQDRQSGSTYEFRYGATTSAMPMGPISSGKYRMTVRIAGSKRPWICRACMLKGILLPMAIGLILGVVIPAALALAVAATRDLPGGLWNLVGTIAPLLAILCFGIGLSLIVQGIGEIGVSGENRAIEANNAALQQAGYDKLLNHRDFKKLSGL